MDKTLEQLVDEESMQDNGEKLLYAEDVINLLKQVRVATIKECINKIQVEQMKYFIDFEFLEGDVPVKIFGLNVPKWLIKPNNTIQPISVGICSSDGREYYAISKDFNLKEAWNRYELDGDGSKTLKGQRVYWIRENVLKPIWEEKCKEGFSFKNSPMTPYDIESLFTYSNFKKLLNKYGKTNKQIAEEIIEFTSTSECRMIEKYGDKPEFYGYEQDKCFVFINFMKNYGSL